MVVFKGASDLVLPNPTIGNSERVDLRTKIKRSMNGKPFTFVDTPCREVISFSFPISLPIRHRVKTFIIQNRGRQLTLIDHNSVSRIGRIITDPVSVTSDRLSSNTLTLEFEVVDINGSSI